MLFHSMKLKQITQKTEIFIFNFRRFFATEGFVFVFMAILKMKGQKNMKCLQRKLLLIPWLVGMYFSRPWVNKFWYRVC